MRAMPVFTAWVALVTSALTSGFAAAQDAEARDDAARIPASQAPSAGPTGSSGQAEPAAPKTETTPVLEPEPVPEAGTSTSLFVTGAAITAGFYGVGFANSYFWPNSPAAESLRIPVAGPWMALPQSGCGDNERGCDTFPVVIRSILTGLSAVGQTGGVLLMIESLFLPSGDDTASTTTSRSARLAHGEGEGGGAKGADIDGAQLLYTAPVFSDSAVGVVLGGQF